MSYRGDGGPPPPPSAGGGYKSNDPMFGFAEQITKTNKDGEDKQYDRRVKTWYVPVGGKDKPCTMLDRSEEGRYTCSIHEFVGPDGRKGSMVRCIAKANPTEGCPICEALGEEGRWFWALTCIDQSKFIPQKGKNKGQVYTNFRRLVLVTSKGFNDMKALEEKVAGGWRGRRFDVSRSEDTKSSKIGTLWFPSDPAKMTDDELHKEFSEAAENYGLSVEDFCEPFDYESILKTPTYAEAVKIAAQITGTDEEGSTVPAGDEGSIEF